MDKISLKQSIQEQWHFLGLITSHNQKSDLSLSLNFWEDKKQKKAILFQNSVLLDDSSKTIFYWEKVTDETKGFFGDGDVDVSVQSGKTLFRKVKHLQTDESGNSQLIDLNLGDISKRVKVAAKEAGWKFKIVLRESKAIYTDKNTSRSIIEDAPKESIQEENRASSFQTNIKPSKVRPKKSMGITFWIAWILLTVFSFIALIGLSAHWITYPIIIGILALVLGLRKFLFKGFIKGTLLLVSALIIIFIVLFFNLKDQTLNQDTQALQDAFASQDIQVVETYLHPESKAELLPIFTEHQSELTRISELMKTKQLIYSDDNYAEYEVRENGQIFTMVFEKVGESWLLVRF